MLTFMQKETTFIYTSSFNFDLESTLPSMDSRKPIDLILVPNPNRILIHFNYQLQRLPKTNSQGMTKIPTKDTKFFFLTMNFNDHLDL